MRLRIRLGYVAMSVNLEDCSPSKTVTVANLMKLGDWENRLLKLKKIARENLNNTLRLLKYNRAHDIKVYRLTSKLIPLATHSCSSGWDYIRDLEIELLSIGSFIKMNGMRVSSHPDHFTLLNSPKSDVLEASLRDLEYHEKIFDACGLDRNAKIVLHVGGMYKNREESIERFKKNYRALDGKLKSRIILENDDKSYTAEDVLSICTELGMPMVLDVHHDRCNPSRYNIARYLDGIFDTWKGEELPPKVHISSPRSEKDIKSHADFIDLSDFISFLEAARNTGRDFDVMIEAKQKDEALLRLMHDIRSIPWIRVVNGGELEI